MLPALCRSDDAPRDELMNRDPEVRPWMSTILDCPGGASEMLYQPVTVGGGLPFSICVLCRLELSGT